MNSMPFSNALKLSSANRTSKYNENDQNRSVSGVSSTSTSSDMKSVVHHLPRLGVPSTPQSPGKPKASRSSPDAMETRNPYQQLQPPNLHAVQQRRNATRIPNHHNSVLSKSMGHLQYEHASVKPTYRIPTEIITKPLPHEINHSIMSNDGTILVNMMVNDHYRQVDDADTGSLNEIDTLDADDDDEYHRQLENELNLRGACSSMSILPHVNDCSQNSLSMDESITCNNYQTNSSFRNDRRYSSNPPISPPRIETTTKLVQQQLHRNLSMRSSAIQSQQTRNVAMMSPVRQNRQVQWPVVHLSPGKQQQQQPLQRLSLKGDERTIHDDWKKQLYPFVSDIVFCSVISKQHHLSNNKQNDDGHETNNADGSNTTQTHSYKNVISFRPYTCQAAILFVDLCGYSKITAAIAHRGAHFLSETVNAYLSRLLSIVADYGGDVIKFAGDAIMIIWYGSEQELEVNVLCAAICATELQTKAGEHKVGCTEDNLSFQIHCGLCCGPLDSEVFEAPIHNNMQRLYHYVGGEAILEIGELVDLAKAGEICVSRNCFNFLENGGTYTTIEGPLGAKLLHSLDVDDPELFELIHWHIKKSMNDRAQRRILGLEEDFIHSNVLAYLSHGGFSPTQIAQMRNLCVLFIAMTSKGSSVNWLMEVQAILDTKRCPIVQIILDDKGVHIVAAVNLYEAIPEASLVGLEVCRELVNKRVGAAVGCAIGPTFCGVTGSTTACRWDITGPSVVRAARLMQYALSNNVHFAIDQSLYDDPMAATRMKVLNQRVPMKGTPEPIVVYTLSDATLFSAFRILENVHGSVHNNQVQEIQNHIDNRERSAVIVTGIPLAGVIIACQRAAGYSDFVPYLHLCEVSAGFLQLARTIATWFQYINDSEVKQLSQNVISDMSSGCWSCAHDQCVHLVNVAIEKGYRACFVVDRIHYLDKFSSSLIRECLQRPKIKSNPTPGSRGVQRTSSEDTFYTGNNYSDGGKRGQICFLCTHLSLYNSKSADDMVCDITRSHQSFKIPIVTLGESNKDELRTMIRELVDIEVEDRWLDAYAEASGHCAEYLLERAEAIRKIAAVQWKAEDKNQPAYFEISDRLVLHIPPRLVRKNKEMKVTDICPELAMIFSNIYDDFPPICQMVIKVITIATRRGYYRLPYGVLYNAMNDLFENGVARSTLDMLIEEMIEMCIIKIEDRDERTVGLDSAQLSYDSNDEEKKEAQRVLSIQSPALEDITMDVCTPVQVRTIAKVLINRLEEVQKDAFQISFTLASLYCLLDEHSNVQRLWRDGYQDFLVTSMEWPERRKNKWKEIIDDEIRGSGYNSQDILGVDFFVPVIQPASISPCIALLKFYSAPIALGPMSQSIAILCRNTFYESGLFAGGTSVDATTIRNATNSTCGRYMMQLSVVENYLRDMGFGAPWNEVESEMEMISFIANPAESSEGVATKAVLLLEEIVPRFIEHRLQRLYKLVRSLKESDHNDISTNVFDGANTALRLAYEALQSNKSRMDAAQDALMILATMNWKPKFTVMEYLPLPQQHTVANIRDATLKRLSEVEGDMFRHRQNVDDLEAFLIVSALIENGAENGLC